MTNLESQNQFPTPLKFKFRYTPPHEYAHYTIIICIMIYVYDLILSTPMSETGLLDVDIEGDDKMVRPNTIDYDESTKKCESANRKQCSKYKLDSYAYYRFVKIDKFQHRWH